MYFPMENLMDRSTTRGPGSAAWVHRGPRRHGQESAVAPWQRVGARAHRSSPAAVEEDEPDDPMPEGLSSEHGWWRRGGATEAKNGGLISVRGRRKA
jgi:hypothetical protein